MNVQFLQDVRNAIIPPAKGKTIVVHHHKYEPPIIDGVEYYDFNTYKDRFPAIYADRIICVGANRFFTPSGRCHQVYEYLQTLTNHIDKYSIDTEPFIGEPWRLWFHYSIAYGEFLGFNYSYPVEGDWLKWFLRERDHSIFQDMEVMPTYTDLPANGFAPELYKATPEQEKYYAEVKAHAFEKYHTPKTLINFTMAQMNKHLGVECDFDSWRKGISPYLPDLKIYKFWGEENKRRANIYNQVITHGQK